MKHLKVVPEAPRTSVAFPKSWDWDLYRSKNYLSTKKKTLQTPVNFEIDNEKIENCQKSLNESKKSGDGGKDKKTINNEFININAHGKKIDEMKNAETLKKNLSIQNSEEIEESQNKKELNESNLENFKIEPDKNFDIWTNENSGTETSDEEAHYIEAVEEEEKERKHASGSSETNHAIQESIENGSTSTIKLEGGEEEIKELSSGKREMTEREIAEERQRLLDEGILKLVDDDDDDDDEDDDDDGKYEENKLIDKLEIKENKSQDEKSVEELIREGSMEKLASLVLEGRGNELLGKISENEEIQSFLDNLPFYMVRYSKVFILVHETLQQQLKYDYFYLLLRRKFLEYTRQLETGL